MTPYQMPSAGPQNSSPPPVPPVFNPAYLQEKRRLRQTSLFFGIATILYFAASVVISNLLNFLIQLSYQFFHRPPFGNSEVIYYLSSILAYILTFSIAYGAYMLLLRMPWKAAVPFRPVAAGKVLLCIPVTFSISIIGSIFTSILSILFTLIGYQPVSSDVSVPMTVPGTILYFIMLAVLPPIFEEIAFRGILMQSLRRFGDGFALLVSSILFGLFHLNMIQAPYAFLLGLWLGYLVLRTGSLRISMVLHACINFSAGVMSILTATFSEQALIVISLVYLIFWIFTGVGSLLFLILRNRGSLGLYPAQTWMHLGKKLGVFFSSVPMIIGMLLLFYFLLQNFVRVS